MPGTGLALTAADYPPFYRSLLAGEVVRPRARAASAPLHLGPARSAPPAARCRDPRQPQRRRVAAARKRRVRGSAGPMREKLGLAPPERRTGLAAHDFAQALGARHGLSHPRAEGGRRADRAVALAAAAARAGQGAGPRAQDRARRSLGSHGRASATSAELRPRAGAPSRARRSMRGRSRLSVTRIERWIANPYEIFARNILKLEKLKELGAEPDAAHARPDRAPRLA